MYLYDRQPSNATPYIDASSFTQPTLPRSPVWRHRAGYPQAFGEAPAAPKGLLLPNHFHTPKQPDPATPGRFVTGALTTLNVANMNPGFIDASDQLITDTSSTGLQTCLQKLIATRFPHYLANKQNPVPSANDRVRVALVDLTGDKITRPDLAGWGSTAAMYGASVPKILAVYAAHQLRADLRQLALSLGLSDGKALEKAALNHWQFKSHLPNLVWLFDIRNWSGNTTALDFTAAAQRLFQGISHNAEAGELIIRVGFPYLASVTWQSGLFHPTRGGLWLTSSYGRGEWGGNPVKGVNSANVTALAVATYFTLLAQGRLVNDASSGEIITTLRTGCTTSLFPSGLGVVAAKCGIWSDYLHDCALIVRGGIRYVVAGLTRTRGGEYAKYTQLFQELDQLIVRNNQSPKPSC
ncbi:MAG: hypothetical protein HOP19_11065 [Acidobacteria bacterium]|nr:hypothetical protein [Acidobacteriota bacterium]